MMKIIIVLGFDVINKNIWRNNKMKEKIINGSEYWKEYDENNNEIHHKDSSGYEYRKEYD